MYSFSQCFNLITDVFVILYIYNIILILHCIYIYIFFFYSKRFVYYYHAPKGPSLAPMVIDPSGVYFR